MRLVVAVVRLGTAQRVRRAAEPRRPGLGLVRRGAAESTATSALLGHLAAGRGHPGVADEGALADLDLLDPQPAAAELVAAEQGVVGEERAVVDRGQLSGSAAPSTPRRPCRPGPRATRSQAGVSELAVEREQPGAGLVEDPQRRPRLPRPAGCASGGGPALRPDRQQPHEQPRSSAASTVEARRARPAAADESGRRPPARAEPASESQGHAAATPAATASTGSEAMISAMAAYAAPRPAGSSGRAPTTGRAPCRAGSRRGAGPELAGRHGTRTPPSPGRPRRRHRRRRPGRACCARRPARRSPTAIRPMCSTSPSIQWPVRSTSGSIEQPSAERRAAR